MKKPNQAEILLALLNAWTPTASVPMTRKRLKARAAAYAGRAANVERRHEH